MSLIGWCQERGTGPLALISGGHAITVDFRSGQLKGIARLLPRFGSRLVCFAGGRTSDRGSFTRALWSARSRRGRRSTGCSFPDRNPGFLLRRCRGAAGLVERILRLRRLPAVGLPWVGLEAPLHDIDSGALDGKRARGGVVRTRSDIAVAGFPPLLLLARRLSFTAALRRYQSAGG